MEKTEDRKFFAATLFGGCPSSHGRDPRVRFFCARRHFLQKKLKNSGFARRFRNFVIRFVK
ncbi:MAG: hypothetical protein ACI3YC_04780, partial [Alloprevotella sp.]